MALPTAINLTLPLWVNDLVDTEAVVASVADRMDIVLGLVDRNITEGGGPFGAAVFDGAGRLVAAGVNRVVPDSAPIAHAEVVAIAAAGQRLGTWDLRSLGHFELVTSTEPCAMCLGAVPWSGVSSLVAGARDTDARDVGFDEGHKPARWVEALAERGVEVVRDVRRAEAVALLGRYADRGGPIYNGAGPGGRKATPPGGATDREVSD